MEIAAFEIIIKMTDGTTRKFHYQGFRDEPVKLYHLTIETHIVVIDYAEGDKVVIPLRRVQEIEAVRRFYGETMYRSE